MAEAYGYWRQELLVLCLFVAVTLDPLSLEQSINWWLSSGCRLMTDDNEICCRILWVTHH